MSNIVSEDIEVERDGLVLRGCIEYLEGHQIKRVVIVMHGFLRDMGRTPNSLYQQISDGLVQAGFACVRFNFNGRGTSDGSFANSDVFNQIEDALAVLNYVQTTYDPVQISLLGHSQGGVVAGMVAGMYTDTIHSLVMLAPAVTIKDDALRGTLLGIPFDSTHIPQRITLRDGQVIDGKFVRIAQMLPIIETTAMFHGPVLAIQGTDDLVIGPRAVQRYANAMPNCEVSEFANLGHAFDGTDRAVALTEAINFLAEEYAQ